jgi:hypothetical protein
MTPYGRFSKDPQARHTGMYIAAPVALRTVITAETGEIHYLCKFLFVA